MDLLSFRGRKERKLQKKKNRDVDAIGTWFASSG